MGYNRAGHEAKLRLRRRRKDERRLALKEAAKAPAAPVKPGVAAKVKQAAATTAAVAKGVVEGVKEGLKSERPKK
jgi:hypothetical protein